MARAAGMGLCVCKPYGDSAQYDVGIEDEGRLLRVQIKSTTYSRDGSFTCNVVGRGRKGYVAGVVDFFAIYLVPMNVCTSCRLRRWRGRCRYSLLQKGRGISIRRIWRPGIC